MEGIYSGCMDWVHAPPSSLAPSPLISSWSCIILAYFFEILASSSSQFFVPQAQVELFVLTIGIFILWDFDNKKNKETMARTMPLFCIPSIKNNIFTMLHPSPTSKIFSTRTLHYELKNLHFVLFKFFTPMGVKVFWPCRAGYKKTFSTSFKCYNLKIYAVKKIEIFSTYFHTDIKPDPTFEVLKKYFFFLCPSLVYLGAVFQCFWRNIVKVL
jgi:hypothetical protein